MTKVVAENTNTFYIISLTVFISIIPHQYFFMQERRCILESIYILNDQRSAVCCYHTSFFLFWLIKTTFTFDRCSISRYEFAL